MSDLAIAPAALLRAGGDAPARSLFTEHSTSRSLDRGRGRGRRPRWPWVAAAICFVQYLAVGIWLIAVQGYSIGDASARTTGAAIMVLGRDPHLGAMGFYWPPLPMFLRVPFVLALEPFGLAIYAGPISTALCAALVIPVLAAIGRELHAGVATTALFIALYALNPITVFSAADAMSEAMFALVMALAFLGLIRVARRRTVRDLAFMGAALGAGAATRLEFVPLTIAFAVACVLLVPKELRRRAAVMVIVPPLFVFSLWCLASSLIIGDAFFWYHQAKIAGSGIGFRPWLPTPLTPVSLLGYVGYMLLVMSPALLIATVVCLVRRQGFVTLVGLIGAALTVPAFVAFQVQTGVNSGEVRYFALVPLSGCVVSLWAVGAGVAVPRAWRRVLVPLLAVAMGFGAVTATYVHANPSMTQLLREGVFYAPLVGKPAPEHSTLSEVRALVARLDPELAKGRLVAMDSLAGVAFVFSRHPKQFIVPEDRKWEQIMADPTGRFEFAVIQNALPGGATESLKTAITRVVGGSFQLVGTYGSYELYEFEADVVGP